MRAALKTIYIDESGNTGSNLLDKDQPVFATASCDFSLAEAEYLLSHLSISAATEAHFKRLRKSPAGRNAIIKLLTDELINTKHIKIHAMHKEFMALTKIVDTLIEFYYNAHGYDFYKNGQNISCSNMLWYCLPTFCDTEQVRAMYAAFIAMVRAASPATISAFYYEVNQLKNSNKHARFNRDIDLILATQAIAMSVLKHVDKFALDPSIPSLFIHCAQWGDDYPAGFAVKHDDSNTLEQQQHMVTQFMDWTKSEVVAGYDRRKFTLPLKAKTLDFVCSKQVKQIQVMDIVASSLGCWASSIATNNTSDAFFQQLDTVGFDNWLGSNKIWPQPIVDPQELGTVYDGSGANPADASALFLIS